MRFQILDAIDGLDDIRLIIEGAFMAKSALSDLEQRGALGMILAVALEKIAELDQHMQAIREDLA